MSFGIAMALGAETIGLILLVVIVIILLAVALALAACVGAPPEEPATPALPALPRPDPDAAEPIAALSSEKLVSADPAARAEAHAAHTSCHHWRG